MSPSELPRAAVLLRWAGTACGLCLAALWATYYLTLEPSTAIEVRWREGLSYEQRVELERRYLLVFQQSEGDEVIGYDLLDTRPSNIAALVNEALKTSDIDLTSMTVPFHAEYGKTWVWAAHRTPGLRQVDVRRAVIGGVAIVALLALLAEVRRR